MHVTMHFYAWYSYKKQQISGIYFKNAQIKYIKIIRMTVPRLRNLYEKWLHIYIYIYIYI